MKSKTGEQIESLQRLLDSFPRIAVAISGGVDSLTLATFAHRHSVARVEMFHAISPAVPGEATERTQLLGEREGWNMTMIDTGEFSDPRYRSNPVNRCFYCKTHLYSMIAGQTTAQIVSGTNLDDLGEYRPGLEAARERAVRHPYVETGIDKQTLRSLAAWLGLQAIADLPASPCLSSRIETAIAIEPRMLRLVHSIEKMVKLTIDAVTVRCRLRASGLVIELDERNLHALSRTRKSEILVSAMNLIRAEGHEYGLSFAPYRNGSAFIHPRETG